MLLLGNQRIVTAKITYRLPEYRSLLQEFIWQKPDAVPECPELVRFLQFWSLHLDGPLHSVLVKHSGKPFAEFRNFSAGRDLCLH